MKTYKLGSVLAKVKRPGKLKATEYQSEGLFPVIDQGEGQVAGYTDIADIVLTEPLPIVVFGDHTRRVKYAREPFVCGADGTQLLYPNTPDLDPHFFYYAIQNIDLSNYFYARHFKFLKDQEFRAPDLESQHRIVAILSAYDDLIENNRRRIGLLEDTARQLYKEWFVRFRFPGHEHFKIVDGMPDGWKRLTLREVATLHYGKALKDEIRIPGDVPVYGSSGIVGLHDKALVPGPGIILGRKGNVGSVRWSHSDFFPIDTVYYVSNQQSDFHLYLSLQYMHFMSTDVAVPGLNREFAYSRPLVRPSFDVGARFEEEVSPIFCQVQRLTDWNARLAKARDLLLPRLMSGAITL